MDHSLTQAEGGVASVRQPQWNRHGSCLWHFAASLTHQSVYHISHMCLSHIWSAHCSYVYADMCVCLVCVCQLISLPDIDQQQQVKKLPWVPAPQSPEGRRPVCIQSLFILCTSLSAVMDTSWLFSPNSNMCAKRGMYRHGSVKTCAGTHTQ